MPATVSTNVNFVDLNVVGLGEVATPLQKLLQEIDIVMTVERQSLITNYTTNHGIDKFLFKTGVNASSVATYVKDLIYANISTDYGYNINVTVEFLKGLHDKDTMLVQTDITGIDSHEKLSYIVS